MAKGVWPKTDDKALQPLRVGVKNCDEKPSNPLLKGVENSDDGAPSKKRKQRRIDLKRDLKNRRRRPSRPPNPSPWNQQI